MKKFIQLNETYLNVDHIVSIVRVVDQHLRVTVTSLQSGEYGLTSCSHVHTFDVDSREGQALLRWLGGETEVLTPYEPGVTPPVVEVNTNSLGSRYDAF